MDAVLSDLLTRRTCKSSREFYGTPGDREIILVNTNYSVPWPQSYGPKGLRGWRIIPGSHYEAPKPSKFDKCDRKLGVRIDLLCINPAILDSERGNPFFGPISLCVFNVGGHKNGAVIGGCEYYWSAEFRGNAWVLKFRGGFDA